MSEQGWPEAVEILSRDPSFGPLVRKVGPIRLRPVADGHFASLLRAVVYQQLAGKAAAAIHARVLEALGGRVTPDAVLAVDEGVLRASGLSRSKVRAVRDLADQISSGAVVLDDLDDVSDDEIVERLVRVWGIGPWTARMFLLFQLRRPDVWPAGDLGVRVGWARIHGLDEPPEAKALAAAADGYRPWRSAVAWYCWRAVETLPG